LLNKIICSMICSIFDPDLKLYVFDSLVFKKPLIREKILLSSLYIDPGNAYFKLFAFLPSIDLTLTSDLPISLILVRDSSSKPSKIEGVFTPNELLEFHTELLPEILACVFIGIACVLIVAEFASSLDED